MADTDAKQVNKTHNRKKDKFKKKHGEKGKFSEIESEESRNAKVDKHDKSDFDKAKSRNPRAFAINSFVAAERTFRR